MFNFSDDEEFERVLCAIDTINVIKGMDKEGYITEESKKD